MCSDSISDNTKTSDSSLSSKMKVLHFLAENGAANRYQIKKGGNMPYPTVHTSVKALKEKNLIQLKSEKKNVKNVLTKTYELTLKGLCYYLTDLLCSGKPLDEAVLEKWEHILPILDKFSLFKKHGLGEQFKEKVIRAAAFQYRTLVEKETAKTIYVFPQYYRDIEKYIIEKSSHVSDADSMVKWNRILYEDEELRQKTKFYLEMKRDSFKSNLSEIEERLEQVFPLLENAYPDWDKIREVESLILEQKRKERAEKQGDR